MGANISSTGKIDNSTQAYLENIEKTFNMDVDMSVDGNASNRVLPLETPFTVSITYNKELVFGINKFRKEKTYIAKAVGVTEKYHK